MNQDLLFVILTLLSGCFAFIYKEGGNVVVSYDIDFRKRCFKDADVLRRIDTLSIGQCIKECVVRTLTCKGVMYDRRRTICELVKQEGTTYVPNGGCVYITISKMIIEKILTDNTNCDAITGQCDVNECDIPSSDTFTVKGNLNGVGNTIEVHCNNGLYAQFHCIKSGTWSGIIHCPEYGNIALGKPAVMSTNYSSPSCLASNAVDGDMSSFFHTASDDPDPWWRVDLNGVFLITKIIITNRKDCCKERAKNLVVTLGVDLSLNEVYTHEIAQILDVETILLPANIYASYVKIVKLVPNSFHLMEVEVYSIQETDTTWKEKQQN